MLTFYNKGVLDIRAATLMGVNVKEGDNPIGFFGTGLKYAIACTLRMNNSIEIVAGEDKFTFEARSEEIRGKPFGIIYMKRNDADEQRLGFTTDLGRNWQPWMIYRELYCNAKDEGGDVTDRGYNTFEKDRTIIRVSGLDSIHASRREFILEGEPMSKCAWGEVYAQGSDKVFFRGLFIHKLKKPALFTYNILDHIDLTEDRTAKYSWQVEGMIKLIAVTMEDHQVDRFITAPHSFAEHDFAFDYSELVPFIPAVARNYGTNSAALNPSLRTLFEHNVRDKTHKPHQPNDIQAKMLRKAIAFCRAQGFAVDEFPIVTVQSLGQNVFGLAKDGKITITELTFDMGTKFLAGTLIEEWMHLKYHYEDCTREMQNHLLQMIVSLGERLRGEPL